MKSCGGSYRLGELFSENGRVDGKDVVMFIYKEGKDITKIATSVVPTPQQMINWGLK